jgi:TonB family protein
MAMLELNSKTEVAGPARGPANRQPRRLLVALALLLVALGAVMVKNREFWFGSDDEVESDATTESRPSVAKTSAPATTTQTATAAKVESPKASVATKPANAATEASGKKQTADQPVANVQPPAVVAKRSVLPPLDVEVIAGDAHHTAHPKSDSSKLEISEGSNHSNAGLTVQPAPATNAAQNERLSTEAAATTELHQTIDSTYPLLGKHSSVQGSVVLQAVVGADGVIQNLRVLSGPAILSAAAQQAVRQWHFKPVLQHGQPVETLAKITVNFSIHVSDNAPNAS